MDKKENYWGIENSESCGLCLKVGPPHLNSFALEQHNKKEKKINFVIHVRYAIIFPYQNYLQELNTTP